MKAIIIAAGMGIRLSGISGDVPKPLTPVKGVPLLERIILTCRNAGVTEFGFVTGYWGEQLKEYFGDGSRLGVKIEYVYNPEWKKANGISALKAKELVKGERSFLLLMSDHLFNAGMLKGIIANPENTNLLAIDPDIDGIFDLPDATKVNTMRDRIVSIGKEIPLYNGIDCGMFRLKQNFFSAMEKGVSEGRDQLSNGIEELILMGDFKAHFVADDSNWLDVDTEAAFAFAEKNIDLFG